MALLLSGKEVASALNSALAPRIHALAARGVVPTLATVRVGGRPDDVSYETGVCKRCAALGLAVTRHVLPQDASQEALLAVIGSVNADSAVHGCLLFRPLPGQFDNARVCNALSPKKDVDGVTPGSLAGVFAATDTGFAPCTAQACMEILAHYKIDVSGKRAVVVGRSLVVGKPVAMLLLSKNATVTVCHTRTENLSAVCREADILIAAAGRAGVVNASCIAPGQVVLDVGIHVGPDGRLSGDVDFAGAEPVAGAITPVPGGVGAVTTSVLAKHVVLAAERACAASAK